MSSMWKIGFCLSCAFAFVFILVHLEALDGPATLVRQTAPQIQRLAPQKVSFDWRFYQEHYPASKFTPIPPPVDKRLPRVQYSFTDSEAQSYASERQARLGAVKDAFQRCWNSYRDHAWTHDELKPLSGGSSDPFGGWAATLIDSLDTLWIMNLTEEFEEAVDAAMLIDFSFSNRDSVNVFEMTSRYLGGFLAAYDLSGDERLLGKALDLADMLYAAFDTPNRLPVLQWNHKEAEDARTRQVAPESATLAEVGSLTLEFTRLSQITRDPKWYDAVARIMSIFDREQNRTKHRGMWPLKVNLRDRDFSSGNGFSFGAMSTTVYDYLPKMYALLGGSEQYARMHKGVVAAARQRAFFRPMTAENADVLMPGTILVNPENSQESYTYPEVQHLACYIGGTIALGGRLLNIEGDEQIGRKLIDGCIWASRISPLGIMPERFTVIPCQDPASCEWTANRWHEDIISKSPVKDESFDARRIIAQERLLPGISSIPDHRYLLRSEIIESIFVLYRMTGDMSLQDVAWELFGNIHSYTITEAANAALVDVMNPTNPKNDSMESWWMAETLKYFYLTFSNVNLVNLDEFVLNTKAHPLKRPTHRRWGDFFG